MTFSIAARCPKNGMFGIAIATSSIAVGNRCPWARSGVGAILTQHRTDIRLGPMGLDLLQSGKSAEEVVKILIERSEFPDLRQVAAIDNRGTTAYFNGPKIESINSSHSSRDVVALGNIIASPMVPEAMVKAYEHSRSGGRAFAECLLDALDGGIAAGGETQPLKSAALLIVEKEAWPLVDLRVDFQDEPAVALRDLWRIYKPQVNRFVTQVLRPHEIGSPKSERLSDPDSVRVTR